MSGRLYRLTHSTHHVRYFGNIDNIHGIETIAEPRVSCLDTLKARVTLALKRMDVDTKAFIEGVSVERCAALRGTKYQIYAARFTLEQAVYEVMRIVEEREQ